MEEAIHVIQAFIGKEYEALVAQCTEPDDSIFKEKRNEVRQFYGADLTPEVNRPEPLDTLVKLIEVRKFQALADPENLKDYEAE